MFKSKKNKLEIDPPKRARRAIKKLHTLVEYLEFYCGGNSKFFRDTVVKDLAQDIEEVLHALSIEKNIDHVRLATKLKGVWMKNLDDTIEKRVEKEVEAIVDEIKKDGLE